MDWDDEYSHNSFDLHCLLNSFPGDLEFEQIFSDIDEKIEQNAARWEMKKDETLQEEEKAMLEHLKQICTPQNSSASDNTEEQ